MATTTHPHFLAVDGAVGAEGAVLDEAELVHHLGASSTRVHHLRQYNLEIKCQIGEVCLHCRSLVLGLVQCTKQ